LKEQTITDDVRLVEELAHKVMEIKKEISRIIIGQDVIIDQLIVSSYQEATAC
jgi:hypothetical protein